MQGLNSLCCPICYMSYDEDERVPRIIPCANGHSVCSYCLQMLLNKSVHTFACPFDREKINTKNKTLSNFPKNIALRDFIKDFGASEFCKIHSSKEADLVCLQCHVKICYLCERQTHHAHNTVLSSEIWVKAQEKAFVLKEWVSKVEDLQAEKKATVASKQEELMLAVDSTFQVCIEELEKRRKTLEESIRDYFTKLEESKLSTESGDDLQVMSWRDNAKAKVQEINIEGLKMDQNDVALYDIFDQEVILNTLNIGEWITGAKNQIEVLKDLLNHCSLKVNDQFLETLKNGTFANFYPEGQNKKAEDVKASSVKPNKLLGNNVSIEMERKNEENKYEAIERNENRDDKQKEIKNKQFQDIRVAKDIKPIPLNSPSCWSELSLEEKDQKNKSLNEFLNQIKISLANPEIVVSMTKGFGLKLVNSDWQLLDDQTTAKMIESFRKTPEEALLAIFEANFTCENLTNDGLKNVGTILIQLSALNKLTMTFQRTEMMNCNGLGHLEHALPHLKNLFDLTLDFSGWGSISDKSVGLFASHVSRLQSLTSLSLIFSSCLKIRNVGVRDLIKVLSKMKYLKKLNLSFKGCKYLNNDHLEEIGQSYVVMGSLEQLVIDFRKCPKLTYEGNEKLVGPSASLSRLKLTILRD